MIDVQGVPYLTCSLMRLSNGRPIKRNVRPVPPKGDDDHLMICSTQSRGTQEAGDSKEVSSTQSWGTRKVIDVRGGWYLKHALMRLSNVCPIE